MVDVLVNPVTRLKYEKSWTKRKELVTKHTERGLTVGKTENDRNDANTSRTRTMKPRERRSKPRKGRR